MNALLLRWIESRVRGELCKQDLTSSETSAHGTVWPVPAPNGATVMFLEQGAPALAVEHTLNKKNKRLTRWILVLLGILAAGGSAWFWI
jgi:hypothetical protein